MLVLVLVLVSMRFQVTVKVTANHKGYFTFRLCRNNNIQQDPDQVPGATLRGL